MDRAQRRTIVFRDVVITATGALGFLWQVFGTQEPSLLIVGASIQLLLAPVGIAVWSQRKAIGQGTTESSTGERPQSSPSPASPQ